jgi:ribosomal protein L29
MKRLCENLRVKLARMGSEEAAAFRTVAQNLGRIVTRRGAREVSGCH